MLAIGRGVLAVLALAGLLAYAALASQPVTVAREGAWGRTSFTVTP